MAKKVGLKIFQAMMQQAICELQVGGALLFKHLHSVHFFVQLVQRFKMARVTLNIFLLLDGFFPTH